MMSIRNPDDVPTTFATVTGFEEVLTPRQIELKRINIARDLRKSRTSRSSAELRVIF
jgi:hypothetical protein